MVGEDLLLMKTTAVAHKKSAGKAEVLPLFTLSVYF